MGRDSQRNFIFVTVKPACKGERDICKLSEKNWGVHDCDYKCERLQGIMPMLQQFIFDSKEKT